MSKYRTLSTMLESRIQQGDYALNGLPTESGLAVELGISRMTARRVLLELVKKGLLQRKPHGKLVVNPDFAQFAGQLRLAFLGPTFSSRSFDNWRVALGLAASNCNASVRSVDYVHWNDPVIPQTLAGFDGVFLAFSSEAMPDRVLEKLALAKNLVSLERDLTEFGIPSLDLLPTSFLDLLGNHLLELGHKKIGCLNVQPHDEIMTRRIERWHFWQKVAKVRGQLFDEPVQPYMHTLPAAYELVGRLIRAGTFDVTGVICLTESAALGAMRALHEAGTTIGKDISLAVLDGGGQARYYVPSLTSIHRVDQIPYLEVCINWLAEKGRWVGPLLVQPPTARIFAGESTSPVPR